MQPRQLIDFLAIIGKLKRNTRHVWSADGRHESVAEHCWQLSVMALLVADEFPDVDINKVVKMCLIHDFGEAITGDIPGFNKTKQDEENEELAIVDLLKQLPEGISNEFTELFSEMAELKTTEAKLTKALDNLEVLVAHNESPMDTWIELEYSANLTYGTENVAFSDYLKKLKEEIKRDSLQKIAKEA